MLLGSNIFPTYIRINGKEYQLGELVRRAYGNSTCSSPEEWNDMSERDREHILVDEYYDWKNSL